MTNSKVFKGTLSFMFLFILLTVVVFLAFFGVSFKLSKGTDIVKMIPEGEYVNYDDVNWKEYEKLKGYGILLDEHGNVVKSFNKDITGKQNLFDVLNYSNHFNSKYSLFSYDSRDNTKLMIIFPKKYIELQPTYNLNSGVSNENMDFLLIFLAFLFLYIACTYFLIKRLNIFLRKNQEEIYKMEMEEKDRIFKGLAHDMKTPLSAIIGYNQAIQQGLVKEEKLSEYYEKISNSANILRNRIDGLMNFTNLGASEVYEFKRGDILEAIRRYVGENYGYFLKNQANIEILFSDEEKFLIYYNKELFDRLLQNILQNSIDHNEGSVDISIDFKDKNLFIKDSGKGIEKELWEKIFEPMVTGDPSRSGNSNRGLGLANVKRICKLHGWKVSYGDSGFQIEF